MRDIFLKSKFLFRCGKSFKLKAALKLHMITHSEEKPYKREHCKKNFNCNSNLKSHMRTHSGEEPYKCDV